MTPTQLIQNELDNHITNLNEIEISEDGEKDEVYSHYRSELDYNNSETDTPISDLIKDADLESPDFNIGFEQGYMRGLEVALSLLQANEHKTK